MIREGIDGEEEEPSSRKKSVVQEGGETMLLAAPTSRKWSLIPSRRRPTKVVFFGGENRVPFMALYQVLHVYVLIRNSGLPLIWSHLGPIKVS